MPRKGDVHFPYVYNFRINQDLKKRFDTTCDEKSYNRSAVIRRLMEDWVADERARREKK